MNAQIQPESTQKQEITNLPLEILLQILSHLHISDLLRFSRTCKYTWRLLKSTASLWLQAELHAAAQRLVRQPGRSAMESLELLKKYQYSWSRLSFHRSTTVNYPRNSSFVYELSGGRLVFGEASFFDLRNKTGALHVHDLTTDGDPPPLKVIELAKPMADFAMDISQNLLVLMERQPTGITLHLHTFDTNVHHPEAKQPSLSMHTQGYTTVHIVGPVLAALFIDPIARSCFLVVWNWNTGELIGQVNGSKLDSMTLLAHNALVVANLDQDTLDVYKVELEPAKLKLFQRLILPSITANEDGTLWTYEQALLRAYPPPTWPDSCNGYYEAPESNYPFKADEDDGIIACSFQSERSNFTLFVRRSALLVPYFGDAAPVGIFNKGRREYVHVIPWSQWGPENTRWIPVHCSMRWICYVYGYRVAVLEPDPPVRINGSLDPDEDDPILLQQQELIRSHVNRAANGASSLDMSYLTQDELATIGINFSIRPRALRLLDFNPRAVARAQDDAAFARGDPLSVAKERAGRGQLLVETESNFQERFSTNLPYLETTVKLHKLGRSNAHNVEGVMINANSLILLTSERNESVQIFRV